jgi:hypothetical protein
MIAIVHVQIQRSVSSEASKQATKTEQELENMLVYKLHIHCNF